MCVTVTASYSSGLVRCHKEQGFIPSDCDTFVSSVLSAPDMYTTTCDSDTLHRYGTANSEGTAFSSYQHSGSTSNTEFALHPAQCPAIKFKNTSKACTA